MTTTTKITLCTDCGYPHAAPGCPPSRASLAEAVARAQLDDQLSADAACFRPVGPCPSWCIEEPGHDYTDVDGIFDPAKFELGRTHTLVVAPRVLADAREVTKVSTGEVTLEPIGLYIDALEDVTPRQALDVAHQILHVVNAVMEAEA